MQVVTASQVQIIGHFVLPITHGVCVAATTPGNMESDLGAATIQLQLLPKGTCRAMLNAYLWGC